MKNITLTKDFLFFQFLLAILFLFVLSGCAIFEKEDPEKIPSATHEWKTLMNGYDAFEQKNYENAADIFGYLYKLDTKSRISRLAFYGLACSRLIMADNAKEFNRALELWHEWADSFPPDLDAEDPRMLEPLLTELKASLQEKDRRLEEKENKIDALNEKMEAMQEKINTLTHQLKELEAIDQQIKKRKKEITSPQ
ncbi:MAG: hypothetical protein U5L07_17965 [Desulfobacterales bacterium]|nr:hypothetical protein [Desulfobacterales bacterium]